MLVPLKIITKSSIYSFFRFGVAADHSTRLVGIADQLASSCPGPLGAIALLRGTIRCSANCSFICQVDPLPSGLNVLNKRGSVSLRRLSKSDWRSSSFSFFVNFSLFVPFCT
ncbi:hypothetical protein H5410_046103 [Solanum commersonii]|uniref:Uncharacterized protein n=1 Tax=Solanum commersonii TaxID=4109 RepID=A0A9J5XDF6_SOLCO|nr:hypothetical protein H5410_046103 [Solanum commersonii]